MAAEAWSSCKPHMTCYTALMGAACGQHVSVEGGAWGNGAGAAWEVRAWGCEGAVVSSVEPRIKKGIYSQVKAAWT